MPGWPRIRRLLLGAFVASLCLMAFAAVVALAVGEFDETYGRVVLAAAALGYYSLVALAAVNLRGRAPALTFISLATAVVGLPLVIAAILSASTSTGDDALLRWALAVGVVAFAEGHACLLIARRRETDRPAVRRVLAATLFFSAIFGVMAAVALVFAHTGDMPEVYWRLMGIAFVLAVLGDLLLPILRRFEAEP